MGAAAHPVALTAHLPLSREPTLPPTEPADSVLRRMQGLTQPHTIDGASGAESTFE